MDQKQRSLWSQLRGAVRDEDPRSVQALLSQGARADVVGTKGVAAVHLAVGKETEKSIRCLKLLLQHGANPNVRSSEGLTPLHVAALWGCYQNIKLLLANGGNPNVTDQEGNTPGQFAEQQDNRKCAQLLQSHQTPSAEQEEDLPRFQYSMYSDQTDVSSYPDSDTRLSSRCSMISEFGDDPLSSTRHSALFDRPRASNHPAPWWRRGPPNGHGDDPGQDWNRNRDWGCGKDGPSFLSSTRMSTAGCASAGPALPEDDLTLGDVTWAGNPLEGPLLLSSTRMSTAGPVVPGNADEAPNQRVSSHPPGPEGRLSARDGDALTAAAAAVAGPSRRASRKSVSFREAAEYFPVFSPDSPPGPPVDTAPFDSSQGTDFLNSERLVTVLHRQGIDVTSPDHVHVFDWDCSANDEGDMEKTVISNFHLEGDDDDDEEEEDVREVEEEAEEEARQPPGGVTGSSSGSGSHYSSCDSDPYTTAHYTTAHGGLVPSSRSASSEEEEEGATEGAPKPEDRPRTDHVPRSQDVRIVAQSEQEAESKPDRPGDAPTPSDQPPATDPDPDPRRDVPEKAVDTASEDGNANAVGDEATQAQPVAQAAAGPPPEDPDLPFTPSPFVTGRTRSRLSRCSMRNSSSSGSSSRALESLFSDVSLFEQTLPTPVRTGRNTPRCSDNVFYSSPRPRGHAPPRGDADGGGGGSRDLSGSSLTSDLQESSRSSSGASDSQADTFILPRGGAEAGSPSQSLADTLILERNPDPQTPPCEGYLKFHATKVACHDIREEEEEEFLTEDRTSSDAANPREEPRDAAGTEQQEVPRSKEKSWITEGSDTDPDPGTSSSSSLSGSSSSSSSSSCYFSPRRPREGSSDTPGTPGCTPRFSMSRLSLGPRRSQSHLAPHHHPHHHPQSYTPGGRPAAPPPEEEPVEYLYTDTEQGHELIETHIPPRANSSLCSSGLSGGGGDPGGEDTVLYDWRSLRADVMGGKENQAPPRRRVEEVAVQLERKKKEEEMEEERMRRRGKKRQEEVKGGGVLPDTLGITDKELRRRLLALGESPGPISARTRPVYMKRLCRLLLESNSQPPPHPQQQQQHKQPDQTHTGPGSDSGYSVELSRALRTFDLPDCHAAELELCQQFDQPDQNKKWREGVIKSSFNYLLLDPRVTKNLPFRSRSMSPQECFHTFVHAVFYVGKGKRSRPYSHLYEALEYHKGDKTSKKLCSKVQHILGVWREGQGVVSLHCFQNVIPVEAFTREACMVDAIGLKMLTNQKRGDYYGVVSTWQARKRRELGVHLLYRAMQIFLAEGERQLRPADIKQ